MRCVPSGGSFLLLSAAILSIADSAALAQCEVHEGAKLTASDPADQDYFGDSVSLSGDRTLVGVYGDDCLLGPDCGSAHLYRYDGATWVLEQKLTASDAGAVDSFGRSVSISGSTAVVGAPLDNCPAPFGALNYCGSAYIFGYHQDLGTWVQVQKLSASDAAQGGEFGWSVSLSGSRAIVGGLGFSTTGPFNGSAYVYGKQGSTWVQEQKLYGSDQAPDDLFGSSVCISGDRAIVGARGAACPLPLGGICGSAYIYRHNGTTWVEEQKLSAAPVSGFAWSVSLSGDRAIVGAVGGACPAGFNCGSAYIYRYNGTAWVEEQKLVASDAGAGDRFGFSVSLSGDRVIVGAIADTCPAGFACGSAYVYRYDGTAWIQEQKLTASDAAGAEDFGVSVSLSGDRAVVGASYDDCMAGINCGSAYVFDLETAPFAADCNANRVSDECDLSHGLSLDCNSSGVPDECEVPPICTTCGDCNANGVPDECDIADCAGDPICGDCNGNAIPDVCDIAGCPGTAACSDCNSNGIPDECDLAGCTGDSRCSDCNGNSIPDVCEADCDSNGVPDECDLAACSGDSACGDRNHNLVPDGCEIGACCDHDPFGGCSEDLLQVECNCSRCEWTEFASCEEVDCPHDSIPAVSTWGLAVLSLLLLTGAKVRFGRREGLRCGS